MGLQVPSDVHSLHVMNLRVTLLAAVYAFAPLGVVAQEGGRPSLTIGRAADARPVIDGVVDDEVWSSATPFTSFIQQEPNEGEQATERTELRFLLDRQPPPASIIHTRGTPRPLIRREIHATL
jgi:hypothetical protein